MSDENDRTIKDDKTKFRNDVCKSCRKCKGGIRKFGFNRNGSRRYRCDKCKITFSEFVMDGKLISEDKLGLIIKLYDQKMSVRKSAFVAGVARGTIEKYFKELRKIDAGDI